MSRYRSLGLFGLAIAALGGIYLFIHFVLLPDIHRYVALKERLEAAERAEADLRQSLAEAQERLAALRKHAPFLKTLQKPMDPGELRKLLETYFQNVRIRFRGTFREKDLAVRRYRVEATMEETRSFFAFLEDIKKRGYPLEIELPLVMRKDGSRISVSFGLRLYSLR